ncbi:MAG: hypothetical protein E7L30_10860 [Lactococcus lactis]|uniref:Uncharacterized protein n=1 Tax=Lactococcus cremoris subsp. cremoris TIFN3 TaxID=1234873 RepID=T0VD84_LACLC|nr:hypothetical protein [Lactococcus cremoris]EQC96210.1 hypothetical protein LLT3_07830 [Lactococcus cremoris subsp. cremoris TIFN3]MDU3893068.1 hypothetical protein [Lactococcus lactis]MDU4037169.1 hypothetical protein [Lactococcus lactis]MDU7301364.1 hypothetical protein [Lactococcus lactis]WKB12562.1 hypothetical protein LL1196_02750 [Lactococcus cremoris]
MKKLQPKQQKIKQLPLKQAQIRKKIRQGQVEVIAQIPLVGE